jgi:hypothetical protein
MVLTRLRRNDSQSQLSNWSRRKMILGKHSPASEGGNAEQRPRKLLLVDQNLYPAAMPITLLPDDVPLTGELSR